MIFTPNFTFTSAPTYNPMCAPNPHPILTPVSSYAHTNYFSTHIPDFCSPTPAPSLSPTSAPTPLPTPAPSPTPAPPGLTTS